MVNSGSPNMLVDDDDADRSPRDQIVLGKIQKI